MARNAETPEVAISGVSDLRHKLLRTTGGDHRLDIPDDEETS